MTDAVTISIVTAVAGIATAYLNGRIKKVSTKIDGRMDELLELTRKESTAKGNLAGRAELKNEQDVGK